MPRDADDRPLPYAISSRSLPVVIPWFTAGDVARYLEVAGGGGAALVAEFEAALAAGGLAPQGIVVGRGRDGLSALLAECVPPPPGEVIVPGYTDRSVAETIERCGYRAVPADVRPDDGNMTAEAIERVVGPRTHAVLATHIHGHPADMDEIAALCRARGLVLLEDAAHALGSTYRGRAVGGFGAGAFSSFAPFKVLQTHGGGVVWSADAATAARLRQRLQPDAHPALSSVAKLGAHAVLALALRTPVHDAITLPLVRLALAAGRNPKALYKRYLRPLLKPARDAGPGASPFSGYQAALGLAQLDSLPRRLARRADLARLVRAETAGVCFFPGPGPDRTSTELVFGTFARDPEAALRALAARGVGALRSQMINLFPADADTTARWVSEHLVIVPLHAELRPAHVERLIDSLRALRGLWVPPPGR